MIFGEYDILLPFENPIMILSFFLSTCFLIIQFSDQKSSSISQLSLHATSTAKPIYIYLERIRIKPHTSKELWKYSSLIISVTPINPYRTNVENRVSS